MQTDGLGSHDQSPYKLVPLVLYGLGSHGQSPYKLVLLGALFCYVTLGCESTLQHSTLSTANDGLTDLVVTVSVVLWRIKSI